jgi:LacI family transcriptional regulator
LVIRPLRRTPELIEALVAAPIPVVVIGDLGRTPPLDTVRVDSRRGIKLAFEHLRETGRERIGFINGPVETVPGRTRIAGYQEACAAHDVEPYVVETSAFTVAAGEQGFAQLASQEPRGRFDAVLAANDLLALGAMRAALTAGWSVPAELAIAGVDDIEFARIFSPPLTSVSLGTEQRGRLAASLLLDRMEDRTRPPQVASVRPKLVVRESTSTASTRSGS